MKKNLFIFANPEFDTRSTCGISKLYQVFFKKYGYDIEIVNEEFLKNNLPYGDPPQILVIAGGDGTIHRVINVIPDNALGNYIFGVIPAGTANEFAKSLKLPLVLEDAAEIIARQKIIKQLHPGVINQKYRFVTGFLYGIACKVVQETSKAAKHYLGQYAYQLPGLFYIVNYQDFVKKFKINSTEFSTGYLLINSASLISKGISPSEIKNSSDSLFSIIYLAPQLYAADSIRLIVKNQTMINILQDPSVFYSQANELTLNFEGEIDCMLDGETYRLGSPIKFEHFKNKIRVIV